MNTMRTRPLYFPPQLKDTNLSKRETELMRHTLLTDKEIADVLHISYHTVKSRIKKIKNKTGMMTTRQLVYYATKKGYLA